MHLQREIYMIKNKGPGVMAHAFNPNIQKEDAGRSLSFLLAWSPSEVPEQSGLHSKNLSISK